MDHYCEILSSVICGDPKIRDKLFDEFDPVEICDAFKYWRGLYYSTYAVKNYHVVNFLEKNGLLKSDDLQGVEAILTFSYDKFANLCDDNKISYQNLFDEDVVYMMISTVICDYKRFTDDEFCNAEKILKCLVRVHSDNFICARVVIKAIGEILNIDHPKGRQIDIIYAILKILSPPYKLLEKLNFVVLVRNVNDLIFLWSIPDILSSMFELTGKCWHLFGGINDHKKLVLNQTMLSLRIRNFDFSAFLNSLDKNKRRSFYTISSTSISETDQTIDYIRRELVNFLRGVNVLIDPILQYL